MKWIDPEQLPPKFFGSVWFTKKWKFDGRETEPRIATVQNHYRGTIPEIWTGTSWEACSSCDTYDVRVALIAPPDSPPEW